LAGVDKGVELAVIIIEMDAGREATQIFVEA